MHSWGNPKQSPLDIYHYALQILYLNLNPIKYSKQNKTTINDIIWKYDLEKWHSFMQTTLSNTHRRIDICVKVERT